MLDATPTPTPLVQVRDLKMHFPIHTGLFRRHTGDVKAVDGINFDIMQGETLGLVGESGCGKSTVGRALLRLYEPTHGQIRIGGNNIAWGSEAARTLRHANDRLAAWISQIYLALSVIYVIWLMYSGAEIAASGIALFAVIFIIAQAVLAVVLYWLVSKHVLTWRAGRAGIPMQDFAISESALRKLRPMMQMVFQDPQASLNPRLKVSDIIGEPLMEHTTLTPTERQARVLELMDAVGLNRRFANRFSHEFSGGQRQRIGIARALALNPKFIVCDEPIAALDVSIQAQVVNLLEDLQEKFGLTYLFISHDLSMVRHIADRVAVMYLGHIAELSPRDALYANPLHPYAKALLSAVPEADPTLHAGKQRIILQGDVPSPANPPKGCTFCTRCPQVFDTCRITRPKLTEVEPGRMVACHLFNSPTAGSTGSVEVTESHQQGVSK